MIKLGIWKWTRIGKAMAELQAKSASPEKDHVAEKIDGIAQGIIQNHIAATNPVCRKKPRVALTESQVADIFASKKSGKTTHQTSCEMGIAESAVRRALSGGTAASKKYLESVKPLMGPVKFDDNLKVESATFGDDTKSAAYERLVNAVIKRGGSSMVEFHMNTSRPDVIHQRASSMLALVGKKMGVVAKVKKSDPRSKIMLVTVE